MTGSSREERDELVTSNIHFRDNLMSKLTLTPIIDIVYHSQSFKYGLYDFSLSYNSDVDITCNVNITYNLAI